MQRAGAAVWVYDPEAMGNAKDTHPMLAYAPSTVDACRNADVVLLLTEWNEFREMDPDQLGLVVGARNLVDGRNVLDHETWRGAGWHIRSLGRPAA